MILPQTSKRISRLKLAGAEKRAGFLALMPDQFTSSDLAEIAGISRAAASAQVQKMVKWREVEQTSEYQNPRIYRKLKGSSHGQKI